MPLGPLRLHHTPDPPVVWLRDLSGTDEAGIGGTGPADAIALLDGLLRREPFRGEPVPAAALAVPDRDRLLAALYENTYGPSVESLVRCVECGEEFHAEFSLHDLVDSLGGKEPPEDVDTGGRGMYRLDGAVRFRLPIGEDELAVLGLPVEEAERVLLDRCVVEGDASAAAETVDAAMERLAPTVDLDLTVTCAECGHGQSVRFEVEHYVLTALFRDRAGLMRDVHRLASTYGWSLAEIMALPRNDRRRLVELVDSDPRAWRKVLR